MTKGIIAITELSDNLYELAVELPTSFTDQFSSHDNLTVFGCPLGMTWGQLQTPTDGGASYRREFLMFKTIERCEEVVRRMIQEIEIAKGHLAQRQTYRLVLDLEPGNRTLRYEDTRNGASNRPF